MSHDPSQPTSDLTVGNIIGSIGVAIGPGAIAITHIEKQYSRSEREELSEYLKLAMLNLESHLHRAITRSLRSPQPYKALYWYELGDAPLFFGRESASAELAARVERQRLTVVHAGSGAGKSSLLNAGLMPLLLRQDRLPVYVRVVPHADLTVAIRTTIAAPLNGPPPATLAKLSLHELIALAYQQRSPQTRELVLILDQFEQLLLAREEKPALVAAFMEALGECYRDRSLPVRFIIAVQSDDLGKLSDYDQQIPNLLDNLYRLRPLTPVEIGAAISQPLEVLGNGQTYAPDLLARLLQDLAPAQAELPHLQIVCDRLFNSLPPGAKTITLAHYESLGGAPTILSGYLKEVLAERIPAALAGLARNILIELVSSKSTNRVLDLSQLNSLVRQDEATLAAVLDRLVTARLIRRDENSGKYELAHAYLAPEIASWIDKNKQAVKDAQDLLQLEVASWRVQPGTFIAPERLDLLARHLQDLSLDAEARRLLLGSALHSGRAVAFWYEQAAGQPEAIEQIAASLLEETNQSPQTGWGLTSLRQAFARWQRRAQVVHELRRGLGAAERAALVTAIWTRSQELSGPNRLVAADVLRHFFGWLQPVQKQQVLRVVLPVAGLGLLTLVVAAVGILALGLALPYAGRAVGRAFGGQVVAVPAHWVLIPGDGAAHVGAATAPNEIALAVDLCQNWEPKAEASYDCDNYRQILSQSLQTTITLASYEILDNETTNAQYQLCVTEGGCTPVGWRYPGKANYPAVGLNWLQADEYCSWLGGRLPSEAEWEKAARGPNGWSFPWGNDWQDGQRANLRASGASGSQLVTTFADRDRSGYGINNLAGNVREWTASAYAPYPATLENGWVVSPTVIQNPDLSVVVRGGGWKSSAVFALSAMRWPVALISPQDSVPWDEIGFRCVCSIPGTCREPWNNGGWQWFGEY